MLPAEWPRVEKRLPLRGLPLGPQRGLHSLLLARPVGRHRAAILAQSPTLVVWRIAAWVLASGLRWETSRNGGPFPTNILDPLPRAPPLGRSTPHRRSRPQSTRASRAVAHAPVRSVRNAGRAARISTDTRPGPIRPAPRETRRRSAADPESLWHGVPSGGRIMPHLVKTVDRPPRDGRRGETKG